MAPCRGFALVFMRAARRASAALRVARFSRSMRATSSAGISSSCSSRHANTTKVANAPTKAATTSHQMCQISEKPMIVAKNAQMKPTGTVARHLDVDVLRLFADSAARSRAARLTTQ